MWTVVGGNGRSKIARLCQERTEAEQWAQQLVEAEIAPVRIDKTPPWREPSEFSGYGSYVALDISQWFERMRHSLGSQGVERSFGPATALPDWIIPEQYDALPDCEKPTETDEVLRSVGSRPIHPH